MVLFFDTETTGIPLNYKAPVTDLNNWPRMVQLAWLLYDERGKLQGKGNHIIKPVGFQIPADAAAIHGITQQRALEEGIALTDLLDIFEQHLAQSKLLVAHNMSFDENILGAEFIRANKSNPLPALKKTCTMLKSVDLCRIPGKFGFKWPKLSELHFRLFKEYFDEAHNAAVDIEITAKCYWEMKNKNLIQ